MSAISNLFWRFLFLFLKKTFVVVVVVFAATWHRRVGHQLITTLPRSEPGCCCPCCEFGCQVSSSQGCSRKPCIFITDLSSPLYRVSSSVIRGPEGLCSSEGDFSHKTIWFKSLRGALCLSHRGIARHKCYLSKKDAVEDRAVSRMEQMVLQFSAAAPWGVNGFTLWAFFFFFG